MPTRLRNTGGPSPLTPKARRQTAAHRTSSWRDRQDVLRELGAPRAIERLGDCTAILAAMNVLSGDVEVDHRVRVAELLPRHPTPNPPVPVRKSRACLPRGPPRAPACRPRHNRRRMCSPRRSLLPEMMARGCNDAIGVLAVCCRDSAVRVRLAAAQGRRGIMHDARVGPAAVEEFVQGMLEPLADGAADRSPTPVQMCDALDLVAECADVVAPAFCASKLTPLVLNLASETQCTVRENTVVAVAALVLAVPAHHPANDRLVQVPRAHRVPRIPLRLGRPPSADFAAAGLR